MGELREITREPYFLVKVGFVLIYTTPEGRFRRPAGATAIHATVGVADNI